MSASFRTFEISDPRFEVEDLREVTVKSAALGMRADLTLHVPAAARAKTDVPLVILLHGVYGSHWAWTRMAGAHRISAALQRTGAIPPCVLAMPSDGLWGDGSGYVRHRMQDFERWIVDEVPAASRRAAPCVTEQSPCCIAGLSMGGFGALRLAGKYPRQFVAAAGMSSITQFKEMAHFAEEPLERFNIDAADQSVLETILRCPEPRPALRFDCGTGDPLLTGNRALHAALLDAGVPHEYAEFSGGHSWEYWRARLPDTLEFFARCRAARPPSRCLRR